MRPIVSFSLSLLFLSLVINSLFAAAATTQIPCPAGWYCPSNSSQPIACGPSQYCPVANLSQPFYWSPGYYCSGGVNATLCPIASYCPSANLTAPVPCSPGQWCPRVGMTSYIDCCWGCYCPNPTTNLICPAGSFCLLGSAYPTLRPADTISNPGDWWRYKCIPCNSKWLTSSAGSTECTRLQPLSIFLVCLGSFLCAVCIASIVIVRRRQVKRRIREAEEERKQQEMRARLKEEAMRAQLEQERHCRLHFEANRNRLKTSLIERFMRDLKMDMHRHIHITNDEGNEDNNNNPGHVGPGASASGSIQFQSYCRFLERLITSLFEDESSQLFAALSIATAAAAPQSDVTVVDLNNALLGSRSMIAEKFEHVRGIISGEGEIDESDNSKIILVRRRLVEEISLHAQAWILRSQSRSSVTLPVAIAAVPTQQADYASHACTFHMNTNNEGEAVAVVNAFPIEAYGSIPSDSDASKQSAAAASQDMDMAMDMAIPVSHEENTTQITGIVGESASMKYSVLQITMRPLLSVLRSIQLNYSKY